MMRVVVLGGLTVANEHGPVNVAHSLRRPLLLLALLAVAGEKGVPRDRILLYFWGDSPEAQARNALRQTLFRLRRDLDAPELVVGTTALHLNPAVITSDVAAFEDALRLDDDLRAAEAFGGPLLDGIQLRGLPEFERWLSAERSRLDHHALGMFTRLAEGAAARGDHRARIAWCQRLAHLDPLSAPAAAGIIASHAALDERAAALRYGRLYTQLVHEELGTAPDARVCALLASLADGERSATPTATTEGIERPGAGAPGAPPAGAAAPRPAERTVEAERASDATGPWPADAAGRPREGVDEASREERPASPAAANGASTPAMAGAAPAGSRTRRAGRAGALNTLPWHVAVLVAVASVVVIAFAATRTTGTRVERGGIDARLDPAIVVVAPFEVLHADLELWREGMTDVLSLNLDGAGPLRSVSPTLAVRNGLGYADRASAIELGRRTGAGSVVFGSLIAIGTDSVLATISIADVETGRLLGEARHREAARRMDRLTDSLTVAVLRALDARTPIAAARQASAHWPLSLGALRAFLQAEQFYRRAQWDSARAHYLRVIEADSTFALPYRRIGNVLAWQRIAADSQSGAYLLRAGALNRGLGRRDSMLVLADSLGAAADLAPTASDARALTRRLFATLDDATRQYPNDPEVWFARGEAWYHFAAGAAPGAGEREQLAAFRHAIALDSAFAPAHVHTTELALNTEGLDAGLRAARAYLALNPTEQAHRGVRLVERVLADQQGGRGRYGAMGARLSGRTRDLLEGADAGVLVSARTTLRRFPDRAEAAVYIGRLLARGRPSGYALFSDTLFMQRRLAEQLAFRGHAREAYEVLGDRELPIFAELALLGAVPPDRARSTFARWLRDDAAYARLALPWLATVRDTALAASFLERAQRRQTGSDTTALLQRAAYDVAAGEAYLALARGDSAAALARFERLSDSTCGPSCYMDALTHARLLARAGRHARALGELDEQIAPFLSPLEVVFALERVSAAAEAGHRDRAVEAYQFAASAWADADPSLQPLLARARRVRHALR